MVAILVVGLVTPTIADAAPAPTKAKEPKADGAAPTTGDASDAEKEEDEEAAADDEGDASGSASGSAAAAAAPSGGATGGLRPGLRLTPPAIATPSEAEPESEDEAAEEPSAAVRADADDASAAIAGPGAPKLESPKLTPPSLIKKRSVPPFWIDRQYDTHRTRALTLPPLFVHRKGSAEHPEKLFHADLSLTFGWYSQKSGRRRWLSPLGLFFGSYSERTTAWGAGALLMGYKRTGEQFNFGQFPLVWWWGNKHVRNLVVLPVHYHQKTPEGRQGMSGLLFWYGKKHLDDDDPNNDVRYFVGAPLFVRAQKGVKRVDVGVPLYIAGEDKLKGTRHRTLFPFFHWQSSEFGNRRELWTPLYVQRSDRARGRKSWVLPPLLTFSKRTPTRSLFSATPLLWRAEDRVKGSQTWVLGPWVSYADPLQKNNVLAPFWWSFKDRQRQVSTSILLPLAIARKSPDETAVYTLLGGGVRSKKGGFGVTLPPLFTSIRQRPGGKSHQVVTPLFWHLKDPKGADGKGTDRWIIPPLAYHTRVGERRRLGLLPLLTFTGREGTRSHQVVTPLFWHFRDRDPALMRDTFVAGPLYVQRDKLGWAAGLPPLVVAGSNPRQRYTVIPPLLFGDVRDLKEGTRRTISPLFVRTTGPGGARTIGAAAIAWDVKRPGERHSVLFPLYYRRQIGDKALTITPLGGGRRTKEGRTWVYGPVYGRRVGEAKGFGILPLMVRDVRPTEGGLAKHTVVFPLYIGRRTPSDDLDMVTPLFWRTRVGGEKPRRNLALVPFYFRQRQPHGVDVDAGLPFFYSRDRERSTHTLVVGPGFHRLSRTSLNAGIVPIYWWRDSAERRRLISLPIIYHTLDKSSGARTTIAVPLWYDIKRANGSRIWVAFPFAVGNKRLYNFTRVGLVPPGYIDLFRVGKNHRFSGFVPLYFRYQKCGFREEDDPSCRYTLHGSYPLFMYGKDGQGRVTHSFLSLYYFDRDKRGTTLFTPLGGARVRPGEELTWYAGIVGRGVTRTRETTVVFPLFWDRKHRLKKKRTTLVVPPLYIGQREEDSKWFETGLLFWHFRRPHKVSTAVLPPLFYISESYAERRLSWLLPFYFRDNYMGKDKTFTSVFPGLYFQRRKGQDLDVVQFPLIWHIERGKNQGTVGAFLWWDIRVRNTTTQVIPGVFLRRVNRKGQELGVVLPGLAWWTRDNDPKTPGVHWRALLGAIGGGNDENGRYFSLFGGKIKLKPKPVWTPKGKERREARKKAREEKRRRRAGGAAAPAKAATAPAVTPPASAPAKAAPASTTPTKAAPAMASPTTAAPTTTTPAKASGASGTAPAPGTTTPSAGAPRMGAVGSGGVGTTTKPPGRRP
ncbi:MAG: hypothetical protein H6711_12595 [Myxococcales bacterium]|nr:hypothetical protein [Myxococcales bacterium]